MSAKKITPGKIYLGDCASVLRQRFPDEGIDLVFADPPYNASGKKLDLENNLTGGPYRKINEAWDTFSGERYVAFTERWMSEVLRILTNKGSLFISCSMHNVADVAMTGKILGMKLNNIIVWRKTNPMPNITKRMFTHATEFVCWFTKGKGWVFNYPELKKMNPERQKNGMLKQMPDYVELPVVQGKERLKNGDGRALHPTQKPERLIEIAVVAASNPGDFILDPFMGSGTTAVVAQRLGRKWVGVEISKHYRDAALKRVREETSR